MEWTVETICLTSSLHYLELKVQKYSKSLFIKIIKILQNAGISMQNNGNKRKPEGRHSYG